jgi:hypothetical protein
VGGTSQCRSDEPGSTLTDGARPAILLAGASHNRNLKLRERFHPMASRNAADDDGHAVDRRRKMAWTGEASPDIVKTTRARDELTACMP